MQIAGITYNCNSYEYSPGELIKTDDSVSYTQGSTNVKHKTFAGNKRDKFKLGGYISKAEYITLETLAKAGNAVSLLHPGSDTAVNVIITILGCSGIVGYNILNYNMEAVTT